MRTHDIDFVDAKTKAQVQNHIIGRMGIPYKAKHVCLVSIAIDAPEETIGALGGKLGRIRGLTVKTAYSRI